MDGYTATAGDETLSFLIAEVKRMLSVDDVNPDLGLGELGIDSLNIVELMLICDQVYAGGINPENLSVDQHTSLRDLDRQLRAAQAQVAA